MWVWLFLTVQSTLSTWLVFGHILSMGGKNGKTAFIWKCEHSHANTKQKPKTKEKQKWKHCDAEKQTTNVHRQTNKHTQMTLYCMNGVCVCPLDSTHYDTWTVQFAILKQKWNTVKLLISGFIQPWCVLLSTRICVVWRRTKKKTTQTIDELSTSMTTKGERENTSNKHN